VPACRYAESAIREAIKKYDITDPEQERPPPTAELSCKTADDPMHPLGD
jgi:hypothetical protein